MLPRLVSLGDVEQIHIKVTLSAEELEQRLQSMTKAQRKSAIQRPEQSIWGWRLKSPQSPSKPKSEPVVFGQEVGVGEDWSHLNKRRHRTRRESIGRDIAWLKELAAARLPASTNASN